jgi:hypothetical protein
MDNLRAVHDNIVAYGCQAEPSGCQGCCRVGECKACDFFSGRFVMRAENSGFSKKPEFYANAKIGAADQTADLGYVSNSVLPSHLYNVIIGLNPTPRIQGS